MKTEIVSFYADVDGRDYYSKHADRLKRECKNLNIPSDIRPLESRGEYRLNCLRKPQFLLTVLKEKKTPFVWLDIDSIIHNELTDFDKLEQTCDMAFAYQAIPPNIPIGYPKASPIFINYTPVALEFLELWATKCLLNENSNGRKVFDHEILIFEVLPKFLKKLRLGVLGINYAIWPGTILPPGMIPMITMGIADGVSKEKSLREMGMDEVSIKKNLIGNLN